MKHLIHLFISLGMASLLVACGGSSSSDKDDDGDSAPVYSGVTTSAKVTSTNAEDLTTSSAEATSSAISQDEASDANPFGIQLDISTQSKHGQLIADIANALANNLKDSVKLPAGITYSYTEFGDPNLCGGSVTVPDSFASTETLNGTITLTDLCYNDPSSSIGSIFINGTMTFVETASEISISSNLVITGGGETETVNMSFSCALDIDGFPTSCSFSSDFVGDDGKVYRIADFTLFENFDGSYDFSAKFYHPDHGYVMINATNISFGCTSGHPDGGTINITGSEGSFANITFRSDCTGYDGDWNDGISSGVFSGTWL